MIPRDEIHSRLIKVLEGYLRNRTGTFDETKLDDLSQLGIDSLAMLELVFEIEEEFGIKEQNIPEETLRNIRSLDDLVQIVADQLEPAA